jgi:hypothetical protein
MHMPATEPSDTQAPEAVYPDVSAVSGWAPRLIGLCVFAVSASILLTAWLLTPNTRRGVGTHEALGLPVCGLEAATGIPCATCGMTTSFSLVADGRFAEAFFVQPAGALLALATAMAVVIGGYAAATGMSLAPLGKALWRPRLLIVAAAFILAAWVYKIVIHTGWIGAGT